MATLSARFAPKLECRKTLIRNEGSNTTAPSVATTPSSAIGEECKKLLGSGPPTCTTLACLVSIGRRLGPVRAAGSCGF